MTTVRQRSALGARLPSVIEIHFLPLYPRTFPEGVIDFPSLFGNPFKWTKVNEEPWPLSDCGEGETEFRSPLHGGS